MDGRLSFCVVTGFLGAGKTTLMIALKKRLEEAGLRTGIIVNDIGSGDLADTALTRLKAGDAKEIAGGCICYRTDELLAALREERRTGMEFVLSDVIGGGIGAYEKVYARLASMQGISLRLAPFVVVTDPVRLSAAPGGAVPAGYPAELSYLYDASFKEADVIVLNKTDLITGERASELTEWLRSRAPHAAVFAASALTGEGTEEIARFLAGNDSPLRDVDVEYGSPAFNAANSSLAWYAARFSLERDEPLDFSAFEDLYVDSLRRELGDSFGRVAHLKIFAAGGDGDVHKSSLIDSVLSRDLRMDSAHTLHRVIVNARAVLDDGELGRAADAALAGAASASGARSGLFFRECFRVLE